MAITLGGITAEEYSHDYTEGLSWHEGPTGTKGYVVAWADRYTFANACIGLGSVSGGIGGVISFAVPLRHPETPRMFAQRIRIQGKGKPTQGPVNLQYPSAIVWVDFGIGAYSMQSSDDPNKLHNIDPNTPLVYCEQELASGGEIMTIPGSGVKFANGNAFPNSKQDYGIPIGHVSMDIKLVRVPYLPSALIKTAAGTTNTVAFLGAGVGHLRFENFQTRRTHRSGEGNFTQDLHLKFMYRDVAPWDNEFDPTSGTWQQVQGKTGTYAGVPILPASDLSQLIPSPYR